MEPSSAKLSFASETLVLERFGFGKIPEIFRSLGATWDRRVQAWRCDAMHYTVVRGRLRASFRQLEDQVANWQSIRWPRVRIH